MDNAGRSDPTVIVMTALQSEYRAIRAHLTDVRQRTHPAGTIAEVGRLPGTPWRVAVMVMGAGNVSAAVLAERAASWFRPRALLVVGIAGALQDDIQIGDVVVATWVYGYHGGFVSGGEFHARPRAWAASHRLEQGARAVDMSGDWGTSSGDRAVPPPAVHFRPVAAGEVVLNSRDAPLAKQLERDYNDAAAIEMESAGAATAGHLNDSLDVLTIRGISDKADGTKHATDEQGLQQVAAAHAADFAVALLRRTVQSGDMYVGVGRAEPTVTAAADRSPGTTSRESPPGAPASA